MTFKCHRSVEGREPSALTLLDNLRKAKSARAIERQSPENQRKRLMAEGQLKGSPVERIHGAKTLGNLMHLESCTPLLGALASETDKDAKLAILNALESIAREHDHARGLGKVPKAVQASIQRNLKDADLVAAGLNILPWVSSRANVESFARDLSSHTSRKTAGVARDAFLASIWD